LAELKGVTTVPAIPVDKPDDNYLEVLPLKITKAGIKTSEAIGGVGLISTILAMTQGGSETMKIVGIAGVAVLGAAYMISRGIAKK
jgi:hypothetical protein